ncbi:hypothetical protein LEL_07532 [Akanthomyces lecanii RCEF 1005]|uniref:Histidine kinase group protein n=1 Tax=Akanthomyces lecanii RCEF 1005 TaxID=1081108 RepID=A0A168FRW6_CORDF|nr:hypothetical protein LEL_07532 [Akanthomyces lecanii RCEF 1005]
MNPSTPELSSRDPEAFSPESFDQSPGTTSPIHHVRHIVDGAHIQRFKFTDKDLRRYFHSQDPYPTRNPAKVSPEKHEPDLVQKDVLTLLCHSSELAVEIGKYLSPGDIVSLYRASRAFHEAVNQYMSASVRAWIAHKAPEAGRIFDFRLYKRHLIADPAGRTWGYQYETTADKRDAKNHEASSGPGHTVDAEKAEQVRAIPGLRYLQLVVGRDRYCREIRAILARNGHRTPSSMHSTLLKLWLCLDIPTSAQRAALLRNRESWADTDLYNAQLLFVKLGMHFNDPIYGPNTYELLHLMMGQKGLYPLWQLLMRKRFTRLGEILALKVRYDFQAAPSPADPHVRGAYHWSSEYFGSSIHGVPYGEVGKVHLEGWGHGQRHLQRPDELVPVEAVARGLELDAHLVAMMMWGYVDWSTGENLVPSEAEMHISDDEAVLAHADTNHHWRSRHVLKKRFDELAPAERQRILDEDEDERLRAMAWCGETDDYSSTSEDGDGEMGSRATSSLEDEMSRGYMVPPRQTGDDAVVVPDVDDREGWVGFVNDVLTSGLPPDVGGEAALRAEAWQSYQNVELDSEWDWGLWLQQQQRRRRQEDVSWSSDEAGDELPDSEAETIVTDSLVWDGDEELSDYEASGGEM